MDPYKPFLPVDLYSKDSSWICLGEAHHPIPASEHTDKLTSRSVFLQFIRLPGGRSESLEYINELHRKEFPVGTQFALIEQAFLISDAGELILSPLVVSIQIRAYLKVKIRVSPNETRYARERARGRRESMQCVAEFLMQPRKLVEGNAVMRAMDQGDYRFEAGQEDCGDFSNCDPFEKGPLPTITRLNLCMSCHRGSSMRLPGGRSETLNYIGKLHRKEVFPVGTQFALIEQALLISNEGEMILSPLIVSIQLRAFLDVDRHARVKVAGRLKATQCVAEFVMQPRQLMKGNAVMKAMDPSDYRFGAAQEDCRDFSTNDPFERGEFPTITRLNLCMRCHGGAGRGSIQTVGFYSHRRFFGEGNPEAIGQATSAQKRDDKTWKALLELWRTDSAKRGKQSPAPAGQPQPPLE